MKEHLNLYSTIYNLLNYSHYLQDHDYELWATWMKCVASALYLEYKFKKDVSSCKKDIKKHIGGIDKWVSGGKSDCLKWCSKTYDINHPLRFSVETLDNIESIRLYLAEKNKHLYNLLEVKQWFKWNESK